MYLVWGGEDGGEEGRVGSEGDPVLGRENLQITLRLPEGKV